MEISREVDYAIRCVLYLSERPHQIVMAEQISSAMQIPKSFLAKILQKLSRKGLVTSLRGVKGGFRLDRKPEEIGLLDVINVFQNGIAINRCAVDRAACSMSSVCVVHPVWVELRELVHDHIRAINFEDIRQRTPGGFGCRTSTTVESGE